MTAAWTGTGGDKDVDDNIDDHHQAGTHHGTHLIQRDAQGVDDGIQHFALIQDNSNGAGQTGDEGGVDHGLQPLMNLSEISFMLKPETRPMTIIMPKK